MDLTSIKRDLNRSAVCWMSTLIVIELVPLSLQGYVLDYAAPVHQLVVLVTNH